MLKVVSSARSLLTRHCLAASAKVKAVFDLALEQMAEVRLYRSAATTLPSSVLSTQPTRHTKNSVGVWLEPIHG